jgi:cellulose synthase/poly-beta-1,6-N-acetylglucosamine synthase-like glycosyltransferase
VTLLILTGMRRRELPGRGEVTLATNFVRSIIGKSSAEHYRIIVVDDGVVDEELKTLLAEHGHSSHTCPQSTPFSFARKANFATSLVDSGIVLLLNDDLEVISPDWIQELAGQAARPGVGVAGCRLLFGDGTLQHAGIGLGFNGSAGHMFHRSPADGREYGGFASIDRNYSAVTGAVMAYRKEVFDQVGGFDEVFRMDYNDLDFCLRCIRQGLRIVYTGSTTLYHFHNSSVKRLHDSASEREAFLARWSQVVKRDPYFSKNFEARSAEQPLLLS